MEKKARIFLNTITQLFIEGGHAQGRGRRIPNVGKTDTAFVNFFFFFSPILSFLIGGRT